MLEIEHVNEGVSVLSQARENLQHASFVPKLATSQWVLWIGCVSLPTTLNSYI